MARRSAADPLDEQRAAMSGMPEKIEKSLTPETTTEHATKFDLDKIDVKEVKKRIKVVLEELADSKTIPDEDHKQRDDLKACARGIETLIDSYDPNKLAEEDRRLFDDLARPVLPPGTEKDVVEAKAKEMAQERDEMWYAYRGHMQRRVGLILEIATREEFSNSSAGRELLIGMMTSLTRKGDVRMTDAFEEEFKKHSQVTDAEMHDITQAILTIGQTPPEHFEEFYQSNFRGRDRAQRLAQVDVIETRDLEIERVMLQQVKQLLPESERNSALWNHRTDEPLLPEDVTTPEGAEQAREFMRKWMQRIETEGGTKIMGEDGNRYATREKRWGIFSYEKQNRVEDTVQMVKRAVWIQRPDGVIAEENIEVASIDLYSDAPLSFLLNGGPELGKAHQKGRDRIQHVKCFHKELDDIVSAEELRRLWAIPPAIREANGTITIPFHDANVDSVPIPGIFNFSEERYLNNIEKIQRTIENFNAKGLFYAEQKALQDKKKSVYDRRWQSEYEPRPTSSAETEFVRSYLAEELERAAVEAAAHPETQHLEAGIRQAMANINTTCAEHSVTYGHMDKYQKLAVFRLHQRRIDEDTPGWEELLNRELTYVIEYFRVQDIGLKEAGQRVLIRSDMTHNPAATPEAAAENRVRYLRHLANLDHNIERDVIYHTALNSPEAREILNINVPEGPNRVELIQDEVYTALSPIRRDTRAPGEREAQMEAARTTAQDAFDTAVDFMNNRLRDLMQRETNAQINQIRTDNGIEIDTPIDDIPEGHIARALLEEVEVEQRELQTQLDLAMQQFEAEAQRMLAQTPESRALTPSNVFQMELTEARIWALSLHHRVTPEQHDAIAARLARMMIPEVTEDLEIAATSFNHLQEYGFHEPPDFQTHAREHAREFIDHYNSPVTPAPPRPIAPIPFTLGNA